MCGIAGIIAKSSDDLQASLEKMLVALRHRGPDETNIKKIDNGFLGHTRLSIVDIVSGKQPMVSRNGDIVLVFNGEIYGYKDIKKSIKDYNFQTNSDSEVIIALYIKYGKKMLDHLPGMFSFALWDDRKKELFCARDRFGEKPFYYTTSKGDGMIFSSEIRSLIKSERIAPIIDKNALSYYLKRLYINPNRTVYKNIFTLPPAHFLVYKDNKINIQKYWDISGHKKEISLDEAVDKFKTLLSNSVRKCMVADVPVGAMLSGGLDSSTIVALASRYNKNLKTFAFGFDDNRNELKYAREIAQKYKTEHYELCEKDVDLSELLVEMSDIYDEPFGDSSNIPTYLISRFASQHVKTVLTGDGADELLGGYDYWYQELLYCERFNDNPKLNNYFSLLVLKLLNKITTNKSRRLRFVKNGLLLSGTSDSIVEAHCKQVDYFSNKELSEMGFEIHEESSANLKTMKDVYYMDINSFLPGDILVKTDRASMSNSLELRSPFLDKDLATFCFQLPDQLKIDKKVDKKILRMAYRHLWTANIRNRKKQGFGIDVNRLLKSRPISRLLDIYLRDNGQRIHEIIPESVIKRVMKKNNIQTWSLLNLSIWLSKHNYQIK